MQTIEFKFTPWSVIRFLLMIVVVLVILSIFGRLLFYFSPDFPLRDTFIEEFNVDEEGSFPSLFSSLLLFSSACILRVIFGARLELRDRHAKYWKLLSCIFMYLSLDELLSFHERVTPFAKQLEIDFSLYYGWEIIALLIFSVVGFVFFKFWLALPARTRILFALSAAIYISGVLGVDLINGYHENLHGKENLLSEILVNLEETVEMLGVIMFIFSLLSYLQKNDVAGLNIHFILEADKA